MRRLALYADAELRISQPPVIGVPKSGTTWLELMLSSIRKRACARGGCDRRICSSVAHFAKHALDGGVAQSDWHIGIFRDPCDVATSQYYFHNRSSSSLSLDAYVSQRAPRIVQMQNAQARAEANRGGRVFYHELCTSPDRAVFHALRALRVVGVVADDVRAAVRVASFESMRSMESREQLRLLIDKKYGNQPSSMRILGNRSDLVGVMTRRGCARGSDELGKRRRDWCCRLVHMQSDPRVRPGLMRERCVRADFFSEGERNRGQ